jgi:aspartyl protease family protein
MPDIFSHPLLPFIVGAMLVLCLVLASRSKVVRALFSLGLWCFMGFLLWSVAQTTALFDPALERLGTVIGRPAQSVVGEELRVPMSRDGHFWVDVSINGTKKRMMVDSGATVTAIPPDTAQLANIDLGLNPIPVAIRTANGTIPAQSARVEELRLGNIVARDLGVVVSPAFGDSWRVERRTMILKPHHPQPVQSTG